MSGGEERKARSTEGDSQSAGCWHRAPGLPRAGLRPHSPPLPPQSGLRFRASSLLLCAPLSPWSWQQEALWSALKQDFQGAGHWGTRVWGAGRQGLGFSRSKWLWRILAASCPWTNW